MKRSLPTDERNVLCSGRILLEYGCGERLILLLGFEDDYRSKSGSAVFEW